MLYYGNPNEEFVQSVKDGTLEGMTFEGVVCKGKSISPGMPLMFKIKNLDWIKKLKDFCGENQEKFNKLL